MRPVRRALISVHDKRGVAEFARGLAGLGVSVISTGGTARHLRAAGVCVTEVSDFTGVAETLGGRVKTLHPKLHAGILACRDSEAHRLEMERAGWESIDLVAVNLPPSPDAEGADLHALLGTVDIGGPALLRAAAKNCRDVVVVCSPARYGIVLEELAAGDGTVPDGLRVRLAREAFEATACYDARVHRLLYRHTSPAAGAFPIELSFDSAKKEELRYGENPHQRAAIYRLLSCGEPSAAEGTLLCGKALSYNNYVDLDAALEIVKEFQTPACAIVKHGNPCGVAIAERLLEAYRRARATDPESAFGGIVGFGGEVDEELAAELASTFLECVVAPSFTAGARRALGEKKNLRLLEVPSLAGWTGRRAAGDAGFEVRSITGGLLLQDRDTGSVGLGDLRQVTEARPTIAESRSILFAWAVVRHVRSNAIVIAGDGETVGIGAGQMSRVDAARLAILKARKPIAGCVAASDGFFPFRDAVDELARAGVRTLVQPGGSRMDPEVIKACDELGVAMVFTGMRCFRH